MKTKYLDKREVLEGVNVTYENSPATIKTVRFWEIIFNKLDPKDKETRLYVSTLEEKFRGETTQIQL